MRKSDADIKVFIEAVRYAELERDDIRAGESGEMIRAIWQMNNPLEIKDRTDRISDLIPDGEGGFMRFTAHLHNNEPLSESYNDVMIYRAMRSEGTKRAHYLIDRFCPKKVKLR